MAARSNAQALVGALAFFALVVAVANVLLLAQRQPPGVLTAEQTAMGRARLMRLALRSAAAAPNSNATTQVTWIQGGRCGEPLGVAIKSQFGRDNSSAGSESLLWFALDERPALPPRDPRAQWIERLVAARDEAASDLVAESDPGLVVIAFRGSEPGGALRLDNRHPPAGRRSVVLPPEVELELERSCPLGERDLRLMALLARVVRARVCDDLDRAGSRCYDPLVFIYRDRWIDTYRIDLTSRETEGRLALEVETLRAADDTPVAFDYRILQASDLDRPANLFFVRPRPAGEPLAAGGKGFHGLRWQPPPASPATGEARVDLRGLLDGTPWLGEPAEPEVSSSDF